MSDPCAFPDCRKPRRTRGWCDSHYKQGRGGGPMAALHLHTQPSPAVVNGIDGVDIATMSGARLQCRRDTDQATPDPGREFCDCADGPCRATRLDAYK